MAIWAEEVPSDNLAVDRFAHGGTVLHNSREVARWLDALPEPMRASKARELRVQSTAMAHGVVVAQFWSRCTTDGGLVLLSDGRLRFDVEQPERLDSCAWRPRRLELWVMSVDDLGIRSRDRAAVQLVA